MAGRQERFGERLRLLREAAGYSQEQLAERAGLSANAVSALERGERKRPYPDTLRRLAEALGLSDEARAELVASLRDDGVRRAVPSKGSGSPAPIATELPGEPTPLIGRNREAEVVRHLLAHQAEGRLLTLLGPGGVGKTRLALHVARTVADRYRDGVAWVELAPLGESRLVLPTIARALGVDEAIGGDPARSLRDWLRGRQVLVVLDNVEHLLDASTAISDLLRTSLDLTILATSRAPLGIRGEQEYVVPPLELPAADGLRGRVEMASSMELFAWYARQKQPSFAITGDNAVAVAAICRRLGGLPLALELAAARIRYLRPAELLARLDQALQGGGARSLPERQRSLRATLDWSHRLLSEPERVLLRRLAVFAGGCDLEAVEAVGADPEGAAFDRVGALVEQSLVTVAHDEYGTRYGMLEPIRQYALGHLEESGEEGETRRRHAVHFLSLAERAALEIEGRADQVIWLQRLGREHDNLRAALAWSEAAADGAEVGLRLASALWRFWEVRGHSGEGGRWLAGALARSDGLPPELRARALNTAGNLARNRADYERSTAYHEQALALWRELGNVLGIASSLNNLGVIARDRGDAELTTQLCQESLEMFRAAGDEHGSAIALISLGMAASQRRDFQRARSHYQESLGLFRAAGDTWHTACMLTYLARLAVREGEIDASRRDATESLRLYRSTGDPWGISLALGALGRTAQAEGDLDEATARFAEALGVAADAGVERAVPGLLEDLAGVALARDQPDRAARLAGAAEALREIVGIGRAGGDGADGMVDLAGLRAGPRAAAWAAGRALTRPQVSAEVSALAG